MPAYGQTPAGFVVPPLTVILAGLQEQVWQTVDPNLDLSPQTPDGQMLGIIANAIAANWELAQIAYNQYNREDVEGAGLDNVGDLTGTPREGPSYTQVFANLTFNTGSITPPYAAGTLIANVNGQPAQTYANLYPLTAADISVGGDANGVLFESTTIGEVPAVNPGTLVQISTPASGWLTVTNPEGNFQTGTNEELDPAYMLRQIEELAASGSCNPTATAEAVIQLGAAQAPPVTITAFVVENTTGAFQVIDGLALPPHSFSLVVYAPDNPTWPITVSSLGGGEDLIANLVWQNKPAGIATIGTISYQIADPILGPQTVNLNVPTGKPLFISASVLIRAGANGANIISAIQNAFVAAAVAPTPANGDPLPGQLVPGAAVYQSQLAAVIMSVPGVLAIEEIAGITQLFFDFTAFPTNVAPLGVTASQVATIAQSTVATNVVITVV